MIAAQAQSIYPIVDKFVLDAPDPVNSFSKMRLSVTYTNKKDEVIAHGGGVFKLNPDNGQVLDAIQHVVEIFENKGTTIDQGGYEEHGIFIYELNLPDYQANTVKLEKKADKIALDLIQKVETELSKL